MSHSCPSIPARYFDGRSTQEYAVSLSIEEGWVKLRGDGILRDEALNGLEVSERTRYGSRRITFAEGAYVEAYDRTAFDQLLSEAIGESQVVRWQQSWSLTLAALVLTILTLTVGYIWGLPWFARGVVEVLPDATQQTIGRTALESLEGDFFVESKLPRERQEVLRNRFNTAVQRSLGDKAPAYTLIFKKSKIGPNAFALPGGFIVITDELVNLTKEDNAILGVMAHELGHVQHQHSMRNLVSASVVGVVALMIWGDASSFIASIPTVLLQTRYSREFETEADTFALDFLKGAQIPPAAMAQMFRALQKSSGEDVIPELLRTHPATEERIRRFENPDP